jgi:hypothetical protein
MGVREGGIGSYCLIVCEEKQLWKWIIVIVT